VVISTPEYAHGVPGALKNALDWLVSDGELVGRNAAHHVVASHPHRGE
jgi:NAD(P)H-dependent FMN reductase